MRHGWRLDPKPWQRLAAVCRGQIWNRVYLEDDYRAQIPTEPGIYLICASPRHVLERSTLRDRLYTVVYVGQASDLRRRFRQHVRGYGNVPAARSTFRRLDYWYTVASMHQLDRLEQCFIDALGPSANDRNVSVRIGNSIPAGSVGRS